MLSATLYDDVTESSWQDSQIHTQIGKDLDCPDQNLTLKYENGTEILLRNVQQQKFRTNSCLVSCPSWHCKSNSVT